MPKSRLKEHSARESHIQRQLLGGVCTGHFTPGPFAVHVTKLGLKACVAAILDGRRAGLEPARPNVGLAGDPESSGTERTQLRNSRENDGRDRRCGQ